MSQDKKRKDSAKDLNQQQKQSRLPLIISVGLLVVLVGCYFALPNFQDFINNAYQILTSDDKERVSHWVGQFGFWGPFLIIVLMLVQMFLFVIPSALVMIVCILAYGPYWGSILSVGGVGIASSIGYAIGAYLGPLTVNKLIGYRTEQKLKLMWKIMASGP
ncbi:TVP38/TMEM64 family protein [Zunongwangia sp. H14]|uniref:TVP38/TMEM64 family protein n=1 Tax=Zunongwangia sp. H14 TaxID=3240792 RepID=UPI0035673844